MREEEKGPSWTKIARYIKARPEKGETARGIGPASAINGKRVCHITVKTYEQGKMTKGKIHNNQGSISDPKSGSLHRTSGTMKDCPDSSQA